MKKVTINGIRKVINPSKIKNLEHIVRCNDTKVLMSKYNVEETEKGRLVKTSSDFFVLEFDSFSNLWSVKEFIRDSIDLMMFPVIPSKIVYNRSKIFIYLNIERVFFCNKSFSKYEKAEKMFKTTLKNIIDYFNLNYRKCFTSGNIYKHIYDDIKLNKENTLNLEKNVPLEGSICDGEKLRVLYISNNKNNIRDIISKNYDMYKIKDRCDFDFCSNEIKFSHKKRQEDINNIAIKVSSNDIEYKDVKTYTILIYSAWNSINAGLRKQVVKKNIIKTNFLLGKKSFILTEELIEKIFEEATSINKERSKFTDKYISDRLDIHNVKNLIIDDEFNGKRVDLNKTEKKKLAIKIMADFLIEKGCHSLDPKTKDTISIRRISRVFDASWEFANKSVYISKEEKIKMIKRYEIEEGFTDFFVTNFINNNVFIKVENRYLKLKLKKKAKKYIKTYDNVISKIIIAIKKYVKDYNNYIDKENTKYMIKKLENGKKISKNMKKTIDINEKIIRLTIIKDVFYNINSVEFKDELRNFKKKNNLMVNIYDMIKIIKKKALVANIKDSIDAIGKKVLENIKKERKRLFEEPKNRKKRSSRKINRKIENKIDYILSINPCILYGLKPDFSF